VFNAQARARSSRNLVTNFNDEDDEEPEVLVRALQCAYAATFSPWADALPARVLSSVTHELATSEEATPFATTFGTSLALAPVQAHTGHFAIRREVFVPDDVADDFIKDQSVFVYSNLHDLWVIDKEQGKRG